MKKLIDRGERIETLNEIKSVENISKIPQIFVEISPMQKETLPSHKLQDPVYKLLNPFGLKGDKPSQRNCQNQLSHGSLSHIEQECQESFIQREVHIQQNSSKDLNIGKAKF